MVSSQEAFYKSLSTFKLSMGSIKDQIADIRIENEKLRMDVVQLKQELQNTVRGKAEINESFLKLQEQFDISQEEVRQLKLNLQKAEQENCSNCENLCRLESELVCNRNENFELMKQTENYEYELKHLERQYHECLVEKKELAGEIKTMHTKYNDTVSLYQKAEAEHQAQDEKQVEEIESLKTNLKDTLAHLKEVQDALTKKDEDINTLKEELSVLHRKAFKVRANKKKYKVIAEKLEQTNSANDEKLKEFEKLSIAHAKLESENVSLHSELKITVDLKCAQQVKITTLEEEINNLQAKIRNFESKEKQLNENQEVLNQSINELESGKTEANEQIRILESENKKKQVLLEASYVKSQGAVQKLEQELQMARRELKDRRREVSVLKQNDLEKEFGISELERCIKEKEVLINVKANEELELKKRNNELEKEVTVLQEKLKIHAFHEEERKRSEFEESCVMMRLINQVKERTVKKTEGIEKQTEKEER